MTDDATSHASLIPAGMDWLISQYGNAAHECAEAEYQWLVGQNQTDSVRERFQRAHIRREQLKAALRDAGVDI